MLPLLFLLWGALAILKNVLQWGPASALGHLMDTSLELDVNAVVPFPIALGLWLRWPLSRKFALLCTLLWWFASAMLMGEVYSPKLAGWLSFNPLLPGIPFAVLKLVAGQHIIVHSTQSGDSTPILPGVPAPFLRVTVIPFFFIMLWQWHTLKRRDIKALFYPFVRVQLPEMRAGDEAVQATGR